MLKIKKRELIKVIQDLQAELRPRLGNPYQTCPNDKPWLDNDAYIQANKFLKSLDSHTHCWERGHQHHVYCCDCLGGFR